MTSLRWPPRDSRTFGMFTTFTFTRICAHVITLPVHTVLNRWSSLPIGYWSVPSNVSVSPYIPGAWPYIQRAVGWARKHGLHTIIDLHGAPGSQNGYDNSGQRTGSPRWALQSENVDATLAIIQVIASELGPMIDAIELLNEVAGFFGEAWDTAVRGYWKRGYEVVRQTAGDDILVVIGDAFEGVNVRAVAAEYQVPRSKLTYSPV